MDDRFFLSPSIFDIDSALFPSETRQFRDSAPLPDSFNLAEAPHGSSSQEPTWVYDFQFSDETQMVNSDADLSVYGAPFFELPISSTPVSHVTRRKDQPISQVIVSKSPFMMSPSLVPAFEELGLITQEEANLRVSPPQSETGSDIQSLSPFESSFNSPSPGSDSNLILCPICGNEAGKHNHYGGRACVSCRAFFRRSVQNESFKSFKCNALASCRIDSKSWKSCRFCRFQKCLNSGMKPAWVLNEKERQIRQEKRVTGALKRAGRKKGSRETNTTLLPSSSNPGGNNHSILWSFTQDELATLNNMLTTWKSKMIKHVFKFYSSNPFLFQEILRALYYRTIVPYSTYKEIEGRWLNTIENVLVKEGVLSSLNIQDATCLLKTNLRTLQIFLQSVFLGNNYDFRSSGLGDLLMKLITLPSDEESEHYEEVQILNNIKRELNVPDQLPEKSLAYGQVFASPWAENIDFEERHEQLVYEISPWPVDIKEQGHYKVDRLQVFLLAHTFLLSTDGTKLNDSSKVSDLQDKYLTMLHRYLKFKYNQEASSKLAKGIMISSLAKEALEIRNHRLPV